MSGVLNDDFIRLWCNVAKGLFGNSCVHIGISESMMQVITSLKLSHGLLMIAFLRVGVGLLWKRTTQLP